MGKRNTRWGSNVYQVFAAGERLRKQMHEQGQVKDRRHHLRKHHQCFNGRDVIDWLLKTRQLKSREEAVRVMQTLKQHGIIHHIANEQEFKDQNHFYRFSFDDNTYRLNPDLAAYYWALDIYRRLKASDADVMQEFYLKGSLYSDAFLGCDLVDFIVVSEGTEDREDVVTRLRDLLQRDIIKHVTDDYHFCDDKVIYEFSLDFEKSCSLQEMDELLSERSKADFTVSTENAGESEPVFRGARKDDSASVDFADSGVYEVSSITQGNPRHGADSFPVTAHGPEPKPGVDRIKTAKEQEDFLSNNTVLSLQIQRDSHGFGFVLQGSSPCYVRTVDPLGPAAAAGLKVFHYVSSVNGQGVLTKGHREVGLAVAQSSHLSMTVVAYRNDGVRQRAIC